MFNMNKFMAFLAKSYKNFIVVFPSLMLKQIISMMNIQGG